MTIPFHPVVWRWFSRRFGNPTPPQELGWESIAQGKDTLSAAPTGSGKTLAAWRRVIEPNAALLFRFSAIRFNSHRIHYDGDYVTKVERLPGLVVQSSLVSQLLIEMYRSELPARQLASFGFKSVRQIYDSGKFTIAGAPAADGREAELWALDANGNLAMTAAAKFAQ